MGLFRMLGRAGSSIVKQHQHGKKSEAFEADYEKLATGEDLNKDLYLFLRPLALGGAIRFPNVDEGHSGEMTTFEDVLSRAVDADGARSSVCVGEGGERWGAARIDFEEDWATKIIPIFQHSLAIISIPGYTINCLKESYVIRRRQELLRKTVFVIPPLCCYRPSLLSGGKIDVSIEEFSERVTQAHHERVGLFLPPAQPDRGQFVTMDFETGREKERLGWQVHETTTMRYSRYGSSSSSHASEPYLSVPRMRAAIRMALANR
jgi:hypothetical protein